MRDEKESRLYIYITLKSLIIIPFDTKIKIKYGFNLNLFCFSKINLFKQKQGEIIDSFFFIFNADRPDFGFIFF